ncbi:MAG TPA: ATP-binding protein [Telmatospirillum sp.]|nr:ATP-binding protein [Telmatospirillum sp.]
MKATLRWLWPDTLVGRTVLVLLAGLLLSQLAGVALYSMNRGELASRLGGRQTAERIAGVVKLVEETVEGDRIRVIRAMELPGLHIGWGRNPLFFPGEGELDGTQVVQQELLHRLTGHEVWISTGQLPPFPPPPPGRGETLGPEPSFHPDPPDFDPALRANPGSGPPPGPGMLRRKHPPLTRVAVHLDDGSWLNFVAEVPSEETLWRPRFFGPLSGGLLVVMALSVLAVRRATKPLALLAAAAQRLGRDVTTPPVPIAGPREVRAAAAAFNEMQTRLRRFIEDRTQMIAAISHDLRTPITRLKLRAEFVDDDEQRIKMLSDLDEMEAMIASTLAFARDDAAREVRQPLDLALLLEALCGEFDARFQGPSCVFITAGVSGLKRAFANLLENARKYGGGGEVTLTSEGGQVSVLIEDNGPGIPDIEMERVFAPFYRVESSRNRDTGGTGLGLAVARSAIRAHGGDIILANRPERGLRVTVILPV